MRAYKRAEGTIMVLDDNENRMFEFEPVRDDDGKVTGRLPFRVGGELLEAINKCYRFHGWPKISVMSRFIEW